MKNLIIASTSTIHGGSYLDYLVPVLEQHFENCETVLFIPYARPGGITEDAYTENVRAAFLKINKKVVGLHSFENPAEAIASAKGIFTGGGNTFLLVTQLYENQVMEALAKAIENGKKH